MKNKIWFGFDLNFHSGSLPRPKDLTFWRPELYRSTQPEGPSRYGTETLVGLSLLHLFQKMQNPFALPAMNYPFAVEAWNALDPHQELFAKAQPRIRSLRKYHRSSESKPSTHFEGAFREILDSAFFEGHIDLTSLAQLLHAIEDLEREQRDILLFNFHLQLPTTLNRQLLALHSLLFHLRAMSIELHNTMITEHAFESVRVDSITDYLPKAEYVTNDALIYWQFKNRAKQLSGPLLTEFQESFKTHLHHGSRLVDQLPKEFLASWSSDQLEQALYLVQMDWLLGTESGLLFRIREELWGLLDGYEKVFHPDSAGSAPRHYETQSYQAQITPEIIYGPDKKVG